MKRSILYIAFLFLFTLSCEKEEMLPEIYWGEASALKNNEQWTARTRISEGLIAPDLFAITFDQFNEDNFIRGTFGVSNLPGGVGRYTLQKREVDLENGIISCSFSTLKAHGDVVGNYYHLNESDNIEDFIEITSFDPETKTFEGFFQASFVIDTAIRFDLLNPDTMIFNNGQFQGKVLE